MQKHCSFRLDFIPNRGNNIYIENSSDWTYVRQNVDGFYVNVIEIDFILTQNKLRSFFKLFTHASIYYERDADPSHQPLEKDKTAIEKFHQIGWNITHTS